MLQNHINNTVFIRVLLLTTILLCFIKHFKCVPKSEFKYFTPNEAVSPG